MPDTSPRLARASHLLRRLRESPPRFLALKVRLELRKRMGRARYMRDAREGVRQSGGYAERLPALRELGEALRADILCELRAQNHTPGELVSLLAADLDAGRWRCLGYGQHALEPGRWSEDEFHGHSWPADYFCDIDFVSAGTRCDVKVPWEKSRLQWFSCGALACCIDPDEARRSRRRASLLALCEDWIKENPCAVGVNWVSAMEVALRAINLLLGFALLEGELEEGEARSLMTSAGEHLHYLERFPETSDVRGNHFLATALGLYFLRECGAPRSADASAAEAFIAAAQEQFTPEGLQVEFAPTYHRLSLEMLAWGQALMRRQRPALAARLDPLRARGLEVCRLLSNQAGELPLFGDNDSGKVFDCGQATRRHAALLWLEDPELSREGRQAASPEEKVQGALFAGIAGAAPPAHETPQTCASGISQVPPYVVWETPRSKLVVRAGELGLSGRGSHDHDDNLSFWYSVDGRDLIVEAGCPPYTRDPAERAQAIRSGAHNLISAAGEPRFEGVPGSVSLSLRGGPRASARVAGEGEERRIETELLPGAGSPAAGCPELHRRSFRCTPGGALQLRDQVRLARPGPFELHLHLAPGTRPEEATLGDDGASARVGPVNVRFELEGCRGAALEVSPEESHLEYGASEAAARLTLSAHAEGEFSIETLIELDAGATEATR